MDETWPYTERDVTYTEPPRCLARPRWCGWQRAVAGAPASTVGAPFATRRPYRERDLRPMARRDARFESAAALLCSGRLGTARPQRGRDLSRRSCRLGKPPTGHGIERGKGNPHGLAQQRAPLSDTSRGFERRRHQGGSRTIGAQERDLSPLNRTGQTSDCGNCEPRYLSQGTGRSPRQKQGKRQGRRQHAVRGRAAGRSLSCPTKGVERGISRRLTFSPEGSSSAAPPAIPSGAPSSVIGRSNGRL